MPQITSGVVRFLQRSNTGDYNHKEASAELSFTVGDSEEYQVGLDLAGAAALTKVNQLLFAPRAAVAETPAATEAAPAKAKGKGGRPPKAAEPALDPTDPRVTGVADAPVVDPSDIDDTPVPQETAAVEDPAGLDDLLGEEAPKEITDKEVVSAITQRQAVINNGPLIRTLVAEFAGPPPNGSRDIPQDKRAAFLTKLAELK